MRPDPRLSRRGAVASLAALLGAGVAGCAGLGLRNLTLSHADLQTLIERQFPRERRVLEVVDLSLLRPVVRLLPERNRIATELELSAVERLSGRSMCGRLALDHGLRYEPSDATVRLAQVKVSELTLDVGGTPLTAQAARLGSALVERMLDDFVIYRVNDERREALKLAGLERADFVVTARGIELRFVEGR
jgi:hypothetical protein